jgi:5-methylcytosine-specific restriction endonuclease McrA
MRQRSWTDEQLIDAVNTCNTYKAVVIKLGLSPSSRRTMDRIRYRCNELGLDRSHFAGGFLGSRKHRTDAEVFCKGVQYSATTRRRFLEKVDYCCNECGISEWCGKKIVLQVEHRDGDQFNNELSNLELLCPNCHSQTPTWGIQKSKNEDAGTMFTAQRRQGSLGRVE